jgi:hypothetical protein
MKKSLIIILVLLGISTLKAQEIYVGETSRTKLENEILDNFQLYYDSYEADTMIIKSLVKIDNDFSIIIVLGDWCSDSEMNVPIFFRVIDSAPLENVNIRIFCVDRTKTVEELELEIEKVPTFIIYTKRINFDGINKAQWTKRKTIKKIVHYRLIPE